MTGNTFGCVAKLIITAKACYLEPAFSTPLDKTSWEKQQCACCYDRPDTCIKGSRSERLSWKVHFEFEAADGVQEELTWRPHISGERGNDVTNEVHRGSIFQISDHSSHISTARPSVKMIVASLDHLDSSWLASQPILSATHGNWSRVRVWAYLFGFWGELLLAIIIETGSISVRGKFHQFLNESALLHLKLAPDDVQYMLIPVWYWSLAMETVGSGSRAMRTRLG